MVEKEGIIVTQRCNQEAHGNSGGAAVWVAQRSTNMDILEKCQDKSHKCKRQNKRERKSNETNKDLFGKNVTEN